MVLIMTRSKQVKWICFAWWRLRPAAYKEKRKEQLKKILGMASFTFKKKSHRHPGASFGENNSKLLLPLWSYLISYQDERECQKGVILVRSFLLSWSALFASSVHGSNEQDIPGGCNIERFVITLLLDPCLKWKNNDHLQNPFLLFLPLDVCIGLKSSHAGNYWKDGKRQSAFVPKSCSRKAKGVSAFSVPPFSFVCVPRD